MGPRLLLVAVAVTACIQTQLVPCGDQLCAKNQLCIAGEVCATQDQVTACEGKADGDVCATTGSSGRCDRGVCISVACGNSVVDPDEACDDGNVTGGDGCAADCSKLEMCGDAIVDEGELCDDANTNPSDGCDACATTAWRATAVIGGGIQAKQAGLYRPEGIASDLFGNIYIADYTSRIYRVDTSGIIARIAGTGIEGFSGDGGPATSAEINDPTSVAVDGLGNIYFVDAKNNRIRRIDRLGVITTIAGGGTAVGEGVAATSAEVLRPIAVAVDGAGRVYLTENGKGRVRVIELDGTITTVASGLVGLFDLEVGSDGKLYIVTQDYVYRLETSGVLTQVTTERAYSLAIDATGALFIGTFTNSVLRVDATGTVLIAGGNGAGFGGDGGPATSALLYQPYGLTFDPAGNLYIADGQNQRVRRVDTSGIIDTFAGTGAEGTVGDGGAATSTKLLYPETIFVDAMDNLYIADTYHHRIRRVDATGTITTVAGNGNGVAVDGGFSGDGGPATAAELSYPEGVAVDSAGNVYIADSNNARVRRVDTNGIITTIAGTGTYGYTGDGGPAIDAELDWPSALAVDGTGRVYIGDGQVVRRIDTNGTINTIAGGGASLGDGGPATAAQIDPRGLAIDTAGNLYIASGSQSRIRRVDTAGMISTVAGNGTSGSLGDGGLATSAQLDLPASVAVDAAGRLYIAESNDKVRRVDTAGIISTFAGVGAFGFNGDGGPATAAYFDGSSSVAVDSAGNVFVLEFQAGRVRRISPQGTITTIAGAVAPDGMGPAAAGHLADARAIAVTPQLTLFAGGVTGTVQALDTTTMRLGVVAGRYPHDTATGALARFRSNTFGSVGGVAYSSSGTIYITESSSNLVHAITITGADSTTWTIKAMNGSATEGFADGAIAAARFRRPNGLYFDEATKELLIADTGNHVVRAIDLSSGIASATVHTIAGTPATRGYYGDGGVATDALLNEPYAITRCPNNDLFIVDTGTNRVRRVAAGTNTITTVLGDGVAASSGEGTPATSFPVDTPLGLACDAAGNLFVSSTTTVRLVPANAQGVVDGTGQVLTIYGASPRTTFPASVSNCLTGLLVVDPATVRVADACAGILVELKREKL